MRDTIERRGRSGRPLGALLGTGAAVATGAALLRLAGTGGNRWSYAALSATPVAFAGAGLVGLAAVAARRWTSAAAATLATAVLGAMVVPRALADAQPQPTGPTLTVGSANLYFGRADAHAVVDLVRTHRVDVLSMQELTPDAVTALGAAGLWRLLPHRVLRPEPGGSGTGLASCHPLRERASTSPTTYHWQPSALVELPGGQPVEVVAVHVVAPVGRVPPSRWRAEMGELPTPLPGPPARVLAGDFNATLDHRPLRALLCTGYRDAADVLGSGLRPTWPTDTRIFPLAAIDHVLVEPTCRVRRFDTVPLPGSDHRAVTAELQLPS